MGDRDPRVRYDFDDEERGKDGAGRLSSSARQDGRDHGRRRRDFHHRRRERDRSPGRERDGNEFGRSRGENPQIDDGRKRSESVEYDELGRVIQKKETEEEKAKAQQEATEGLSEEEKMKVLLGFSNFDSTTGMAVEDNQKGPGKGARAKSRKHKARQFMNRKEGFTDLQQEVVHNR